MPSDVNLMMADAVHAFAEHEGINARQEARRMLMMAERFRALFRVSAYAFRNSRSIILMQPSIRQLRFCHRVYSESHAITSNNTS